MPPGSWVVTRCLFVFFFFSSRWEIKSNTIIIFFYFNFIFILFLFGGRFSLGRGLTVDCREHWRDSLDVDSRYYYCDYYCFFSSFMIVFLDVSFLGFFFLFFSQKFQSISSFHFLFSLLFFFIFFDLTTIPNLSSGWRTFISVIMLSLRCRCDRSSGSSDRKTSLCEEPREFNKSFFYFWFFSFFLSFFLFRKTDF